MRNHKNVEMFSNFHDIKEMATLCFKGNANKKQ